MTVDPVAILLLGLTAAVTQAIGMELHVDREYDGVYHSRARLRFGAGSIFALGLIGYWFLESSHPETSAEDSLLSVSFGSILLIAGLHTALVAVAAWWGTYLLGFILATGVYNWRVHGGDLHFLIVWGQGRIEDDGGWVSVLGAGMILLIALASTVIEAAKK